MSSETTNAVILYPAPYSGNTYISIIVAGLNQAGYEVHDIHELKGHVGVLAGTPAIMNWAYEAAGGLLRATYRYARHMARYLLLRLHRCPIITVYHNRLGHDTKGVYDKALTVNMLKRLCKHGAALVILSDSSREVLQSLLGEGFYEANVAPKLVKIAHPTYMGSYTEDDFDYRAQFSISEDTFLFSFAGAIRPYKNIELIIETARRFQKEDANALFLIMGRCSDSAYLESLQVQAQGLENLLIVPEFIPDERMVAFVRSADALILPYNTRSSLNSGTCMLAFTYGRTVVCPCIGTVQEFPADLTFSYSYTSYEEERAGLFDAAKRAYTTWYEDREGFQARGAKLAELVAENNSIEQTGQRYARLVDKVARGEQ